MLSNVRLSEFALSQALARAVEIRWQQRDRSAFLSVPKKCGEFPVGCVAPKTNRAEASLVRHPPRKQQQGKIKPSNYENRSPFCFGNRRRSGRGRICHATRCRSFRCTGTLVSPILRRQSLPLSLALHQDKPGAPTKMARPCFAILSRSDSPLCCVFPTASEPCERLLSPCGAPPNWRSWVSPRRLTASSFRPRKVGRSLTHRSASQVCPVVSKSVPMRQSAVFLFRNDEIRGSIP